MPSSSFVTQNHTRDRQAHNPKTGAQVPYSPFPKPRIPKVMYISKFRTQNPYIVNKPFMAYT